MADAARLRLAAAILVVVAFGTVVGWPLLRLALETVSAGTGPFAAALAPEGLVAIGNSLWISAAVTVLVLIGAVALALLTERRRVPARGALVVALVAPLFVPDFVTALGWTRAYGPAGYLERLAGVELPGLYGPVGIVLVLTAGSLPLAYLLVAAGMRVRAEPDLERAARASGASAWTAFLTVSLPLLAPVMAAAGGLVFATTMNAFGVPAVLGRPAGFATMTTRIYGDLAFSSADAAFERALGTAILLVALVLVALLLSVRLGPRMAERGGAAGAAGSLPRAGRLSLGAAWAFVTLTLVVPLGALLLTALTRAVGLPPTPENLTLGNFAAAIDSRTGPAVLNSLLLSTGTAVVCVALGVAAVAVRGRRAGGRGTGWVGIGFAVPGSVLAIAVLLAYGRPLRDTLILIGLAYVAKLWALGERQIAASVDRIPSATLQAARVHGADAAVAARTVTLPLLAPVLAAAGLLVFVFALHEVTISILLYGPSSATLAVSILNLQQLGDPTVTTALAVLLTALVAVVTMPLLLLRRAWVAGGIG